MSIEQMHRLLAVTSFSLDEAREMGRDCAINGANTTNCNFRLFSSPAMTKAWEQGKRDEESSKAPKP